MSKEKTDLLSYIREGRQMTRSEKLRLIVNLSIPSILAQISATVMFFIDAAMVGHLGERATAAIGIVETTTWLMGGLASAASLGFSVQVAHFIGANDFENARRVLRQSLICCFLWSAILSLMCIAVHTRLPYWLGGSADIAHDASLYFLIIGVAGISSRFNKDIPDSEKVLKCIYFEENPKDTLIYHMVEKLDSYDKIIVVGGFKYSDLKDYTQKHLKDNIS